MGSLPQTDRFEVRITWRRIIVLLFIIVPAVFLIYVGYRLLAASYGPANVMIEAALDKKVYALGDDVKIGVNVGSSILGSLLKQPLADVPIAIQVMNKEGYIVYLDQSQTNEKGDVTFNFKIPPSAPPGEYTAYFTSSGNLQTVVFKVEG